MGIFFRQRILVCMQGLYVDLMSAFNHQLQHETTHLATIAIFCGRIIDYRDVFRPLQKPMEIIGIDGYFIINCGQSISLSDGVGDKRRITYTFWHITLIA